MFRPGTSYFKNVKQITSLYEGRSKHKARRQFWKQSISCDDEKVSENKHTNCTWAWNAVMCSGMEVLYLVKIQTTNVILVCHTGNVRLNELSEATFG